MSDKDIKACAECGASVYPEHIESGKARTIGEKLLCPYCLVEYEKLHHADEQRFTGQTTMRAPGEDEDVSPLVIDDDLTTPGESQTELRAIGGESFAGIDAYQDESHLKRSLIAKGGATRCKTFHAKLNDGAVGFMNRHINEWADEHPDVVIKFATSTIGVWEGKKADPHLILTVFY